MKLKFINLVLSVILLMLSQPLLAAQAKQKFCLENICIGDDIESLDVSWATVEIDYKTNRVVKGLLSGKSVDDVYYEYNELIITDDTTKQKLLPHIIQLQRFDQQVLQQLKKVRAVCTPLSLTGQVLRESSTKLFVTFRAIADNGGRGKFRVVQLEKEFDIFPPHLRPSDKDRYVAMQQVLKTDYPELSMVRDIDSRANTSASGSSLTNVFVGFRFYSDVNAPLVLRIKDLTEIESMDFDPQRSSLCPRD